MREDTIQKIVSLKKELDTIREYDRNVAEEIVDEVLCDMIDIYGIDYNNYTPEEDTETIDVYAYFQRLKRGEPDEKFIMVLNDREYTDRPDETCARNFDILEAVAFREGIRVCRVPKEEFIEYAGDTAIGGYKFSINRRDLERVIAHPQVLRKNKTIPRTISRIGNN